MRVLRSALAACLLLGFAGAAGAVLVPPEGATLSRIHVNFEWAAVGGADEYQLQVVSDDGSPDPFASATPVVDETVPASVPRTVVTSGLAFDDDYAWRVRAIIASVPQAWDATRRFSIAPLPANLPPITITNGVGTPEPGLTLFAISGPSVASYAVAVDLAGQPVWFLDPANSGISDIRLLANGRLLYVGQNRAWITTVDGAVCWASTAHPDQQIHHEAFPMPNGNVLTMVKNFRDVMRDGELQKWRGDRYIELDRNTNEIVWDWDAFDHNSTEDFDPTVMETPSFGGTTADGAYDWTHSNGIVYDASQDSVYISIRHLSRIVRLDYSTKQIIYFMGMDMPSGDTDFGNNLFSFQHAPEVLPDGDLMLFDNGNRRDGIVQTAATGVSKAIELAFTGNPPTSASIVWEYTTPTYTSFLGDADRLPGGNTLVTTGANAQLIEVDASANEVWRLEIPSASFNLYRSERIPAIAVPGPGDPDGDGLADLVDNCPDDANAGQEDNDGDGMGDVCDHDDDDDYVIDVYETNTGVFNGETDAGTDPLVADTDGDTFKDGTEIRNGSDPLDDQSIPDIDGDGVANLDDNCLGLPNSQVDTDQDGYGNACDADYSNDGIVGLSDLNDFRRAYGTSLGQPNYDPAVDSDDNGVIGSSDTALIRQSFGKPPGPSGLNCAGQIPCGPNQ